MHYSPFSCLLVAGLLSALLFSPASSVAQNELVPAPGAVQLRRVWTQEGTNLAADEYGYNVWGGVDLTGDSIADFAVYRRVDNTWLFYAGGDPPSTELFWSMDSVGSVPPYVGDFWGDEKRHMLFIDGYGVTVDDFTFTYDRFRLFEVTAEGVRPEATISVDQGSKDPPIERFLRDAFVLHLNEDFSHDMAVTIGGTRTGYIRTPDVTRQVWFYMGGLEFQLDSPTVVVRDTSQYGTPDNWEVRFADFDGDGWTDMVMGGSYPTGGPMLRFYWGDENSPWSWATRPPDRDLQLVQGEIGLNARFQLFDLDGDHAVDLVGGVYTSGIDGTYVYLSGREKNARTRSFRLDDADVFYPNEHQGFAPGPLNNSMGRYDMLPLGTRYVSGGSTGPDHDYEAYFNQQAEGLTAGNVLGRGGPIGDVTGDGWPDYGAGNETYGPFVNTGIALVLAGGPYIPFDDPSMHVAEYPVAGESGGLYLWPNPVIDELHIAWKGNLKRMPARFAVFDLQGREVISGDVEPYRGAALWRCRSVAAGSYRVMLYDASGEVIATAPLIKQ